MGKREAPYIWCYTVHAAVSFRAILYENNFSLSAGMRQKSKEYVSIKKNIWH
jgi:hypothetical protein